jgi:hypothetical protein
MYSLKPIVYGQILNRVGLCKQKALKQIHKFFSYHTKGFKTTKIQYKIWVQYFKFSRSQGRLCLQYLKNDHSEACKERKNIHKLTYISGNVSGIYLEKFKVPGRFQDTVFLMKAHSIPLHVRVHQTFNLDA